jgi:hypothetical protein
MTFIAGILVSQRFNPKDLNFFDVFIGISIFSPLMFAGFTWYDEAFALGYFLPAIWEKFRNREPLKIRLSKVELLLLSYFLLEFLNGILYLYIRNNEISVRKVRWLVFLVIITLIIQYSKSAHVSILKIRLKHLITIITFLIVYSGWNLVTFYSTGSSGNAQFAQNPILGTSTAIWTNTAFVTLQIYFFLVVAFLVIYHVADLPIRIMAFVIIFLSMLSQGIVLSRSGFLLGFASVFVYGGFMLFKKKYLVGLLTISIFISGVSIGLMLSGPGTLSKFAYDIKTTLLIPTNLSETSREEDRLKQYRNIFSNESLPDAGSTAPDAGSTAPDAGSTAPDAGSTAPDAGSTAPDAGSKDHGSGAAAFHNKSVSEPNALRMIFGYGLRNSGEVLADRANDLNSAKFSMSLLPALFIEVGILGLALLGIIVLITIRKALSNHGISGIMNLLLVFGALGTTTIVNNFDDLVLWIIILIPISQISGRNTTTSIKI